MDDERAALLMEIDYLKGELAASEARCKIFEDAYRTLDETVKQYVDMKQQLAAVQKDSDSRRTVMEHQATMLNDYVKQLAAIKDTVGEENWSLRHQLAASEAKVTQLTALLQEHVDIILDAQHLLEGDES